MNPLRCMKVTKTEAHKKTPAAEGRAGVINVINRVKLVMKPFVLKLAA